MGAARRSRIATALVCVAIPFGAITAAAGPAHAGTCTTSWKTATSGNWNTAARWTAGVPTGTSYACITIAGSYTVALSANQQHLTALDLGGKSGSQLLDVQSSCAVQTDALTAVAPSVVGRHGTLVVDAAGCDTGVDFVTLTNHGVIQMEGAYRAAIEAGEFDDRFVNDGTIMVNADGTAQGNWQNNGAIKVANGASLEMDSTGITNDGTITARGTGEINFVDSEYRQGSGRIVGAHTVVMDYGTLMYAGNGPGTVEVSDGNTEVVGHISAGQTLIVDSDCGGGFATATAQHPLTNRGTIILESAGSPCDDIAFLSTPKLVNRGTVRASLAVGTTAPTGVSISGPVVNDKTFIVDAGVGVALAAGFTNTAHGNLTFDVASASIFGRFDDEGQAFRLGGTLTIATDASFWPNAGLDLQVMIGSARTGTFTTVKGTHRAGETVRYAVLYDDPTAHDTGSVSLTTG
jgi:hypothetical protein